MYSKLSAYRLSGYERSKFRVLQHCGIIDSCHRRVLTMNAELTKKIEQACTTAEEFARLYYSRMDKSRHQVGKLYLDSAQLVWNGNGVAGGEAIQKFLLELPTSEHVVTALDAQPAALPAPSVLLQAGGRLALGAPSPPRSFQQTFLITAHGDKWKIVSDCFRMTDADTNMPSR